jgi:hypothetical protein
MAVLLWGLVPAIPVFDSGGALKAHQIEQCKTCIPIVRFISDCPVTLHSIPYLRRLWKKSETSKL